MDVFFLNIFNLLYNSGDVLPLAFRLVSSETCWQLLILNNLANHSRIADNIGPRLEPCGTPPETGRHFDVVWYSLRIFYSSYHLFVKYDLNQFKALLTQPNVFNFPIKMAWSTQSKAFFKSRNMTPFKSPISTCIYH